ncbi:MAG: hypothetical protein EB015_07815 [Methylocystaceae bacterium]|nr:hypothetical protein [Methylocystaceae bacterium]
MPALELALRLAGKLSLQSDAGLSIKPRGSMGPLANAGGFEIIRIGNGLAVISSIRFQGSLAFAFD